jgi:hypothetical protein
VTALHAAADRYRAAEAELVAARAQSVGTRRHGRTRDIAKANQASLDARRALEHARDQLVAAALAHECAP